MATPPAQDAQTYNAKGLECATRDDYECALTNYNQAIQLKPDWAEPYDNRGLAYAAKGDYPRALADLSQAIQLQPNYADAFPNGRSSF